MDGLYLIAAAFFLPLFPFSMLINQLYVRVQNPWFRLILLLAWPGAGLGLLALSQQSPPVWVAYWAVVTALLYAFRSLVIRDLSLWTVFVATSVWSLLWLLPPEDSFNNKLLVWAALCLPFVVMPWIDYRLRCLFGGSYPGSFPALAHHLPRLAGMLVFGVLAISATPVFPGFFAMFGLLWQAATQMTLVAAVMLLVWLLWSWSGIRLLQASIVGAATQHSFDDLEWYWVLMAVLAAVVFIALGLIYSGVLL